MNEKEFKCPLCDSALTEDRFNKIVGVWEAKKKIEEQTKKALAEAKLAKENLIKQTKEIQDKLAKKNEEIKKKYETQFEKQRAILIKKAQDEAKKLAGRERIEAEKMFKAEKLILQKEFLEKGKDYEKKRTDKLSKMLQGNMEKLQLANKQIEELKEQLKKGTTPQIEGLNLEEELVKELKQKFAEDRVEHHGHQGDILHYIMFKGKEIGLIVYECKKTQKFQKSYVKQIKEDVAKRNASYGVLVTLASEKEKAGFWIDNDILIVHPYGTVYIAEILRKWLIDMCALKLNREELKDCAKKILDYVKSDKFKNSVEDTIHRVRELNELLNKEMMAHKTLWEKRREHYGQIHEHSTNIEKESAEILGLEEKPKNELIITTIGKKKKKLYLENIQ